MEEKLTLEIVNCAKKEHAKRFWDLSSVRSIIIRCMLKVNP